MWNRTGRIGLVVIALLGLPIAASCEDAPPNFFLRFLARPHDLSRLRCYEFRDISGAMSAWDLEPSTSPDWERFCAKAFQQDEFRWRKFDFIPSPGDLPAPIPAAAFQRHGMQCPFEPWLGHVYLDPGSTVENDLFNVINVTYNGRELNWGDWRDVGLQWRPWDDISFHIRWDRWGRPHVYDGSLLR